jgi:hypothetical protein
MRLLWAVDKPTMRSRNILFQEEDKTTYIKDMIEQILAIIASASMSSALAR